MNKNFYQVLAIVLIAYIAFVAIYISWGLLVINNRNATQQWFLYTHNNTVYKLKIADDESEWQKGLSGLKTKPANYDGMIFIFPDKRIRSFWNQNTYLTLDILWLDNFKIVGQDVLEPFDKIGLQIVTSRVPVNYVIEIIR